MTHTCCTDDMARNIMEVSFKDFLVKSGCTQETITALKMEEITKKAIFDSLNDRHFDLLLPKLKVGQHALLISLKSKSSSLLSNCVSNRERSPAGRSTSSESEILQGAGEDQHLAGDVSVKELAELYKRRKSAESNNQSSNVSSDPRMMTVILGGMVYDYTLGRGKRSKCIPQPNPRKVELKRNTSKLEVFQKAKEIYFKDFEEGIEHMDLVDSSGHFISLDTSTIFSLYKYYSDNNYSPSRHKLYVSLDCAKGASEESIFGDGEEEGDSVPESKEDYTPKGYTLPVMSNCIECAQPFRTYTPGKDCLLPDGNLICLQEPQDTCPECAGGYGLHMNLDLFPHMAHLLPPSAKP